MFIKWQSRKRKKADFGPYWDDAGNRRGDTCWQAVLVESKRVDGKPRQQHIACIVGFTEGTAKCNDMQRCYIWETVDRKLHGLNNRINQDDRRRIEAAIAAKVPRPTPDEHKAALRDKASHVGWEWLRPEEQALLADEEAVLRGAETSVDRVNRALSGNLRLCSFCGKSETDAHTLVEGGGACICDECVEKAVKVIAEQKTADGPMTAAFGRQ